MGSKACFDLVPSKGSRSVGSIYWITPLNRPAASHYTKPQPFDSASNLLFKNILFTTSHWAKNAALGMPTRFGNFTALTRSRKLVCVVETKKWILLVSCFYFAVVFLRICLLLWCVFLNVLPHFVPGEWTLIWSACLPRISLCYSKQ